MSADLKGDCLLEDDAPLPNQRTVYVIYGLTVVLASMLYVAWCMIRSLKQRRSEKKSYWLIAFYICIEVGFVLRFFYCISFKTFEPPSAIFGIFCYFPPVFMTTAILYFTISMLNSLDEVYQTTDVQKFGKLRVLVSGYIGFYWICCVTFFILLAHKDITECPTYNVWNPVYFYTTAAISTLAGTLLVVVAALYVAELKNFTYTYADKKVVVNLMLSGAALQLFLRALQAVLNRLVLIEWQGRCVKEGTNYFHIYMSFYFLLSDVLPTLGYILFLRKEVQTQSPAQAQAPLNDPINESVSQPPSNTNLTNLLEKLYKKKETMRNKLSTLSRPELESMQDSP